eukprot:Nitzschia sp. Nitz4//scaffold44_size153857//60500//60829//NITZ4_002717-RA/size153857-processed-gene-0.153-mRNA-1//-1//CDS//3329552145//7863//frame0
MMDNGYEFKITGQLNEEENEELETLSCTSRSCRGVVLVASVVIVALCLCISSSLFCNGQKSSTHSPLATSELEMGKEVGTSNDGIGRGDTEISPTGFCDEPEDNDDEGG